MATKKIQSRIQLKYDTLENWEKATNFIPKAGEICVYSNKTQLEDGSYIPSIKVGDGTSYVNELEFVGDEYISNEEIEEIFGAGSSAGVSSERENNLVLGNLTEYSNETITGQINYKTCLNNSYLTSIYLPNVELASLTSDNPIYYFDKASALQKLCLNDGFSADPNYMYAPLFREKKGVLYTPFLMTPYFTNDIDKIVLRRKPEYFFSDTFSFTLEGKNYIAGTFMNWGEWCSSEYNTGGYYWDDFNTNYIKRSDGSNLIYNYNYGNSTYRYVRHDHLISDGDSYIYAWEEPDDKEPT